MIAQEFAVSRILAAQCDYAARNLSAVHRPVSTTKFVHDRAGKFAASEDHFPFLALHFRVEVAGIAKRPEYAIDRAVRFVPPISKRTALIVGALQTKPEPAGL